MTLEEAIQVLEAKSAASTAAPTYDPKLYLPWLKELHLRRRCLQEHKSHPPNTFHKP